MNEIANFIQIIKRLINSEIRKSNIDAIISSDTDMQKFTCDVKVNDFEYFDVPIRVLISKQASFLEVPKKDSHCLITFRDMNNSRPQLLEVDECEKILIKLGDNITTEWNSNEIIFNGGTNGMAKIVELTTKLNNLENEMNKILTILKTTVIPLAPAGTYPFAPLYAAVSNLIPTVKTDIEDIKIKH